MAQFTNQAQLSYNGTVVNSNIAVGEIIESLSVIKTALSGTYRTGDTIVYAISLINSGGTAYNGVTLTDDLGAYPFGDETLYPLSYETGSARSFVNGTPAGDPSAAVTDGSLVISGISVPAYGNVIILYGTEVNQYAPPAPDGSIINIVSVSGTGITPSITASETVTAVAGAELTIEKSIEPVPVAGNGEVTYTLTIRNSGAEEADGSYNISVTDTFDPLLSDITVTYNGVVWQEGVNYSYDESSGLFTTLQGQITVPGATYTQDPVTGAYTSQPGVAVLVIRGNIG